MRSIVVAVMFAVVLARAPAARAETKGAATVEWLVADADVVVRGRVVKAEAVGTATHPWTRFEVEVAETFKGEGLRRRVFYEPSSGSWVENAMEEGTQVALFLKCGKRVDGPGTPVPFPDELVRYEREAAFPLVDGCELFTCDFDVIRTRTAALAALREAGAYPTPGTVDVWMTPPYSSKAWFRLGGYANGCYVKMPADGRWARQMHWGSGARLWETFRPVVVPAEAATAENVAIFREMLRSQVGYPGLAAEWPARLDRLALLYYPDRATGRRILEGWGIDPGPVAAEVPALPYAPVRCGAWALRVGAVAVGIALVSRWTRRSGARIGWFAWASLALCAAVVAVGLRGRGVYESLVFPAGGFDHALTVTDGWLVVLRVRSGPESYPPLHARVQVASSYVPERSPLMRTRACWGGGGFWVDRGVVTSPRAGFGYVEVRVRLAWIVALLGAWPAWRLVAWGRAGARGWWRRRAGRCRACGYDLRASPGRCPECGAA